MKGYKGRPSNGPPLCRLGLQPVQGAQAQVLLRVSRSVIVHSVLPGGACSDADPLFWLESTDAVTLRSAG
jgi:hypothetical protein